MIDFLRKSGPAWDTNIELEIPVPPKDAKIFVHGMRVELTRMKKMVEQRGKTLKPFKFLHINTLKVPGEDNKCIVILRRSTSATSEFFEVVEEIFGDELGETINAD